MALPDTVKAASWAAGHNPPHKSAGGDYYAVVISTTQLQVYKSTNPGTSAWTQESVVNQATIVGVSSVADDNDKIHIVSISSAATPLLYYHRFDMSDDTMETSSIAVSDMSGMDAPDAATRWCSIKFRAGAANELVIAASGLFDTDMGNDYQRADFWHADELVTTAGGWTGPVSIDASTVALNERQPVLVTGTNDKVHVFWSTGTTTNADIHARTIATDNTLSTIQDHVAQTEDSLLGLGNAVSYDDAGTQRIILSGVTSTTFVLNLYADEDGSDNVGTLSSAGPSVTDPFTNGETGVVSIANDGTDVYALWSGGGTAGVDQDLYYNKTVDDGATWDADTEELDAVTVNFVSAAVLDTGAIAYLYDDGGTTKYGEISLASPTVVDTNLDELALTEFPATVDNDVDVSTNLDTLVLTGLQADIDFGVFIDTSPPTGRLLWTLDNPNAYDTPQSDQFGFSVACSDYYVVAGAHSEDDAGGSGSGKAYIFDSSDGSLLWTLDNPNAYSTATFDSFGRSVACSDSYVVVGAEGEDDAGGNTSGKAYIFDPADGSLLWTLDNPNAYDTSADDVFGRSVACSESYVVVGTHAEDDAGGTSSGKAYIFDPSDGSLLWTLDNPNAYDTSADDNFGRSVACSDSYVVVGAHFEDDAGGTGSGKAYIFDPSDGSLLWTLDNPNPYGGATNDNFGGSVACSESYVVVGAEQEDEAGGGGSGKAYIFDPSDGSLLWTLDNPNAYGTVAGDNFGGSVACSEVHVVVGALAEDDAGGTSSGKAYIFDPSDGSLLRTLDNPNAYDTSASDFFGREVACSGSHVVVGAYAEDEPSYTTSGKAYVFAAPTLAPTEFPATVALTVEVTTSLDTLVLTEFPATITNDIDVNVDTNLDTLVLTEFQATVTNDINVEVDTNLDTLVLTGFQATVSNDYDIDTNLDTLVLTGFQAEVTGNLSIVNVPDAWSIGNAYSGIVDAVGGASPYTFAHVAGTLPDGWTFNTGTAELGGSTDADGEYIFTLEATDDNSDTVQTEYTVTVVADTDWGSVKVLSGFDGADTSTVLTDEGPIGRTLTAAGHAQISTTSPLTKDSSLLLDGTGDYAWAADAADLSVTSQDFAIEARIKVTGTIGAKTYTISNKRDGSSAEEHSLNINTSGYLGARLYSGGSSVSYVVDTTALVKDQVYDVAFTRVGSTVYLFKDGTLIDTDPAATASTNGATLKIGRDGFNTGRDFEGLVDAYRFTVGAGRYSATYAVPAYPHPRAGATVNVGTNLDTLVLTELQATVTVTVDVEVGTELDTLVLTEFAATVSNDYDIDTNLDTLVLTEFAATVDNDVRVDTNLDTLVLTEFAATVSNDYDIDTNLDTLVLTEFPAAVDYGLNVDTNLDTLILTEFPATVDNDVDVTTSLDTLILTEFPVTLGRDVEVGTNPDTLALTEFPVTLGRDVEVDTSPDALVLTELQAGVGLNVGIGTNLDTLVLTEFAATITTSDNIEVNTNLDTLVLTTYPATLSEDENISTNLDTLVLTEFPVTLGRDVEVDTALDTLVLTEFAATVSNDYDIDTNLDTLVLTTYQATLSEDENISTNLDTLVLTTYPVTLSEDENIPTNLDTLVLTEFPVTLGRDVEVDTALDTLVLTTYQATLSEATEIGTNLDTLVLTTYQAAISNDVNVGTNLDTLVLTESLVTLGRDVEVDTALDTLVLTTYQASLSEDENISANLDTLVLTGLQATVSNDYDIGTNLDTLVLTTYPANLTAVIEVSTNLDTLILTEFPVTLGRNVEVGTNLDTLVLTTYPANLSEDENIATNLDTLVLTTYQAAISNDVSVDTTLDALVLTEQAAAVSSDVVVNTSLDTMIVTTYQATVVSVAENIVNTNLDTLVLTESPATIIRNVNVQASTETLVLTLYVAGVEKGTRTIGAPYPVFAQDAPYAAHTGTRTAPHAVKTLAVTPYPVYCGTRALAVRW